MKALTTLIFTISTFVGLGAAGVSLILPNQYTATGLLVVTRIADPPSNGFFTYEGSYAQQNTGSYTATFLSILQSPNNLMSSGISSDLKKLNRLVKVKREGSQAVVLNVKGVTPEEARYHWNKISDAAIQAHNQFKEKSDPLISVFKTPNSPVVLKTYPEWPTVFGVAFMFSAVILTAFIFVIRYLREENYDN